MFRVFTYERHFMLWICCGLMQFEIEAFKMQHTLCVPLLVLILSVKFVCNSCFLHLFYLPEGKAIVIGIGTIHLSFCACVGEINSCDLAHWSAIFFTWSNLTKLRVIVKIVVYWFTRLKKAKFLMHFTFKLTFLLRCWFEEEIFSPKIVLVILKLRLSTATLDSILTRAALLNYAQRYWISSTVTQHTDRTHSPSEHTFWQSLVEKSQTEQRCKYSLIHKQSRRNYHRLMPYKWLCIRIWFKETQWQTLDVKRTHKITNGVKIMQHFTLFINNQSSSVNMKYGQMNALFIFYVFISSNPTDASGFLFCFYGIAMEHYV